jgi:hypothetical protein
MPDLKGAVANVVISSSEPTTRRHHVSEEEQTRRLEDRIDDGHKIWKLSPMDLKSHCRWYDYSRARDEMFQVTDTAWAPGMSRIPTTSGAHASTSSRICWGNSYKDVPRDKIKLPKRQKRGKYRELKYDCKMVPETYRPPANRRAMAFAERMLESPPNLGKVGESRVSV